MIALLILLLAGPLTLADESVDKIELQHFYDTDGKPVYDQIIFWDWNDAEGSFHVRAWCLQEQQQMVAKRPYETPHNNRWHVIWYDADQQFHRHLSSSVYQETWTQIDHERADKKHLDERLRVSLYRKSDRAVLPEAERMGL